MAAAPGGAPARRVGLFGGSFDPVHNAHVALAEVALTSLQLDAVRWIPAGQPWQKNRAMAAPEHRVAMVQSAIAHQPRFVLDRIEIDRTGDSVTLDTVHSLAVQHPGVEWVLLIGQDQYASLHTWRNWRDLLGLAVLAVANRPGDLRGPNAEVLRFPHRMLPLPMLDISSTDIRQRVARGVDITQLVPPLVARYIETHRLYRS
ncbi:MAG: nicotinate-nucleotide adenylyltransferase [Rubrivivax sp.]|nr:nicotinate-nucleotide adenylyltransferase [Rubrivivax sp.]